MAQVLVNESSLEDIADAIREKNDSSDTYLPSQMAGAIRSIPTGVTGVKGNAESSYRTGDVNITPANIGAKAVQTPVSDPTASDNTAAFIASITQNAQGVISATKKNVRVASSSQSGLMSAEDKTALDNAVSAISELQSRKISTISTSISETIAAKSTKYVSVTTTGKIPIGSRLTLDVPQGTAISVSLVISSPYGIGNGSWYFPIYNSSNSSVTVNGNLISYWLNT